MYEYQLQKKMGRKVHFNRLVDEWRKTEEYANKMKVGFDREVRNWGVLVEFGLDSGPVVVDGAEMLIGECCAKQTRVFLIFFISKETNNARYAWADYELTKKAYLLPLERLEESCEEERRARNPNGTLKQPMLHLCYRYKEGKKISTSGVTHRFLDRLCLPLFSLAWFLLILFAMYVPVPGLPCR